jgi:putative FmdB family regulatory protein
MPIYEFYCSRCNTIYAFRSHTVNTDKRPLCPRCTSDTLSRRVSSFAVLHGDKLGAGEDAEDMPFDDAKMERAFEALGSDLGNIDENNPRDVARLMRKLSQAAGMEYNGRMEEMIRRLEAGEDPDDVEQDSGDLDNDENPFDFIRRKGKSRMTAKPQRDDTLYDM